MIKGVMRFVINKVYCTQMLCYMFQMSQLSDASARPSQYPYDMIWGSAILGRSNPFKKY